MTKGNRSVNALKLSTDAEIQFRAAYQQYGKAILNLAFRMTGDEATARDLTQDIFMKVWENFGTFKGDSGLYTWIYRISLNHITNHLNRERKFQWFDLLTEDAEEREEPVDSHAPWQPASPGRPDQTLENKEREKVIQSLISSLPPQYRIPLVLNRYEDLDYQTIADTLGISLSNAETRIFRAKKLLAEKLKPWKHHL